MKKHLWWTLPLSVIWASAYLDHLSIDMSRPGWWAFPLIVTEGIILMICVVITFTEIDR